MHDELTSMGCAAMFEKINALSGPEWNNRRSRLFNTLRSQWGLGPEGTKMVLRPATDKEIRNAHRHEARRHRGSFIRSGAGKCCNADPPTVAVV